MSLDDVKFTVRVEAPTRDHYRPTWVPGEGVGLAGTWACAVVTGETGQDYLGIRGWNDFVVGMTHPAAPFCGFRALPPNLYDDAGHLYAEYSGHDWFEPFQLVDEPGRSGFTYDSGRIERDDAGLHWFDADSRWEMHGETISKVFVVHVPSQPGIEHEVYYRHELTLAHGTVSGEPVRGYFHQDFAYGPPGLTYTDLSIARDLEGMWVSWIHTYEDGEMGGGCFWQGRGGMDFGPGYLLKGGETTPHDDVKAEITLNADNKPTALQARIGGETFDMVLDKTSGPLHFYGDLVKSTAGKPIVESWCWIEYAEGLLSPEILDLTSEKYALTRGWPKP